MAEGKLPEQEAIDEIREEARIDVLWALRELEKIVRLDEGMGGIDAIRIGVRCQQIIEKARVYGIALNIGDEPAYRAELAEAERYCRRGMRRRRCDL